MNVKELEALVLKQGEYLQAAEKRIMEMQQAHMHLVQRADNIVEGFMKELAARDERILQISTAIDAARRDLAAIQGWIGADEEDGPFYPEFKALREKLEDVTAKVEGRNKSAAVKRNMTDPDALKVLNGEHKDMGHKEVAELIGLTYAQVYSCRLGFTFKHVHRDLEKAGWKSPWSKG